MLRSITRNQLLTIGAAAVLIVLLFLVPILPSDTKPAATMPDNQAAIIESFVKASRQRMKPQPAALLTEIENRIKTTSDRALRDKLYDSASAVASRNGEFILASWIYEQRAMANGNSAKDWQLAGQGFNAVARFTEQDNIRLPLLNESLKCLTKASELDGKDLSIQTDLGIAIVSTGQDPMRGVGILKNVVQIDSTNFNALVALGNFSVQSNQPDKAVNWFRKALAVDPKSFWLYRQLALVYEMLNDKANQLECLNKYLEVETDSTLRKEVETQISQLNKPN